MMVLSSRIVEFVRAVSLFPWYRSVSCKITNDNKNGIKLCKLYMHFTFKRYTISFCGVCRKNIVYWSRKY